MRMISMIIHKPIFSEYGLMKFVDSMYSVQVYIHQPLNVFQCFFSKSGADILIFRYHQMSAAGAFPAATKTSKEFSDGNIFGRELETWNLSQFWFQSLIEDDKSGWFWGPWSTFHVLTTFSLGVDSGWVHLLLGHFLQTNIGCKENWDFGK